jgi:hypothetical protein
LADHGEGPGKRAVQLPFGVGVAIEVEDLELLVQPAQGLRAEDPFG